MRLSVNEESDRPASEDRGDHFRKKSAIVDTIRRDLDAEIPARMPIQCNRSARAGFAEAEFRDSDQLVRSLGLKHFTSVRASHRYNIAKTPLVPCLAWICSVRAEYVIIPAEPPGHDR